MLFIKRLAILISLIISLNINLFSQDYPYDISHYNFIVYDYTRDVPSSISNGFINALYKDRSGVLWVGTEKGFNRFNSKTEKFTRYMNDPKNRFSISNNRVHSIRVNYLVSKCFLRLTKIHSR